MYTAIDRRTASAIADLITVYREIRNRGVSSAAASRSAIVGSSRFRMLSAATDHTAQVMSFAQDGLGASCETSRITTQAVSRLAAI